MIPGVHPLGVRPLAVIGSSPPSQAAIATLRYSDIGWISGPTDSVPNMPWQERASVPLVLERALPLSPDDPARRPTFKAEMELLNADGALDTVINDYAIDGRRIVVRAGPASGRYEDFEIVFEGSASGWRIANAKTVQVTLRDASWRIEVPAQTTLYGGTGGLDGGVDLTGKPKPLTYGICDNVTAVLVDPQKLIYQVHDGAIQSIDDVYDRGAALTGDGDVGNIFTAPNPDAGTYVTQVSGGYFRLGSTPDGLITADVQGDADPSFIAGSSDIVRRLLTTRGGISASDIDAVSFAALANEQPADIGIHVPTEPRLLSIVIDEIMHGIGGWWGPDRLGQIRVARIAAPVGEHRLALTTRELSALERIELPEDISPPNWRRRVAWGRNWTIQTTDLAGSVTPERRAFLAEGARIAASADTSVRIKHLLASDPPPVPGLFTSEVAALAEASRLMALWSPDRQLFRTTTKWIGQRLEFGDRVLATWPRYGLAGGTLATVVGMRLDLLRRTVNLDLFC